MTSHQGFVSAADHRTRTGSTSWHPGSSQTYQVCFNAPVICMRTVVRRNSCLPLFAQKTSNWGIFAAPDYPMHQGTTCRVITAGTSQQDIAASLIPTDRSFNSVAVQCCCTNNSHCRGATCSKQPCGHDPVCNTGSPACCITSTRTIGWLCTRQYE